MFLPFLFSAAIVDVFFVLPGFVVVLSSTDQDRPAPVGRFCRRRIERTEPVYQILPLTTLAPQVLAIQQIDATPVEATSHLLILYGLLRLKHRR